MIETSTEVGELAKALAAAQAQVKTADKDRTNPHFGSKYADLASVWDACRGALTANGLSVVQLPVSDGNRVGVVTTLLHASGQWMRGTVFTTPEKATAQGLGSAITYLRRYSLAAAAGVAPDDDDDGNAASGNGKKLEAAGGAQRANKIPAQHGAKMADRAQLAQIHILKEKIGGWTGDASHPGHPYRAALRAYKDISGKPCESSKDLTFDQAANLLKRMQGMVDRQAETHQAMESSTDVGEAADEATLEKVREAARDRWGKHAEEECPTWLQEHFGVTKTTHLTRVQSEKALQLLLSQ